MHLLPSFFKTILFFNKNVRAGLLGLIVLLLMACNKVSKPPAPPQPSGANVLSPLASKDSLNKVWFGRNKLDADSSLLSTGIALQRIYGSNNLDSLAVVSRDMESTGRATGNKKWLAQAEYCLGIYFYTAGEPDSALAAFRAAIADVDGRDDYLLSRIYLNIASVWSSTGYPDSAYIYLKSAIPVAQRANARTVLAGIYGDLGANTQDKGNYLEALDYFSKALEYGNADDSITVMMNKGLMFESLGLMDEARLNNEQAVLLSQKSPNRNILLHSYLAIMSVTPDLAGMQQWLDKGLLLCDTLDAPMLKVSFFRDGVMRYLDSLQLEKAGIYLKSGISLAQETKLDGIIILELQLLLAKLDNARGNYKQSLQKCLELQPLCNQLGNNVPLRTLFNLLSKNYEGLGQSGKALYFLHKKNQLDEEYNNNEQLKAVLSAYLKDKSKNEIISLQKAKEYAEASTRDAQEKAQLSYWIFGLISLFLCSLVLFYYTYSMQRSKAAQQLAIVNANLVEEQKKLERSNQYLSRFNGVISHDILSNLDILLTAGNMLTEETKRKPSYVEQYHKITQQTCRQLKNYCLDLLSQASLLRQTGQFYDPMPVVKEVLERFGSALYNKGVKVVLNDLTQSPLPTAQVTQIFQNLVSNVLRYASDQDSPSLYIGSDKDSNGNYGWVISDNGPGISSSKWTAIAAGQVVDSDKGQGLGLSQLIESLQPYGARLEMSPESAGTKFFIAFSAPQ